jgi:peptidoglycan/LPS O-acetylase OafA/YrhL
MISLGRKMDRNGGFGPGFDVLRLGLSILVVFGHSFDVVPHQTDLEDRAWVWMVHFGVLAMFFALSGYLISGSALRLNYKNFLLNRGLRIFPALVVEIALSALVLGPIFTTLSISTYFTSYETYHYFTNMVGLINYDLPGVFVQNPSQLVNASLWTVPIEFIGYFSMTIIIIFNLMRKPVGVILTAVAISLGGMVLLHLGYSKHSAGFAGIIFSHLDIGKTTRVLTAFAIGIAVYQLRYRIAYSGKLALLCMAYLTCLAAFPAHALSLPFVGLITAAPFAYLIAFIGASDIPTPKLFKRGDYSYGIYLYGFPVQQAVYTLMPTITSPWLQFLMVLPPLVLFATFSWHFIEKPILAQRRRFSFITRVREITEEQIADGKSHALPRPLIVRAKARLSR